MSGLLLRRGFCHVYGDRVPLDDGVMPFRYAIERVIDPQALVAHLFEGFDDGFRSRAKAGDFILAGSDFCCGKVHMQGLVALAAMRMGVLCASMPYKAHRRAVSEGLPVLTGCNGLGDFARSGDEIEVDFRSGEACNLSQGREARFPAMPAILQELISSGGMQGAMREWLRAHPEQGGAAASPPQPQGEPVAVVRRART
jgi:3-isopropylmalate/(R)-2-methylmalate dehydratase small subunit